MHNLDTQFLQPGGVATPVLVLLALAAVVALIMTVTKRSR
jgi:hypothetical protein